MRKPSFYPLKQARLWGKFLLTTCFILLVAGIAFAYLPDLDELLVQIDKQPNNLTRAYIETSTQVYNPFVDINAEMRGEPQSSPMPERNFTQKIYWIAGSFLGVETYAEDGTLLHYYLDEGLGATQASLTDDRIFDTMDILPPYLPFLIPNPASWLSGSREWGISPSKVDIALSKKGKWFYILNEEDKDGEGNQSALWLEKDKLRPEKLVTQIQSSSAPMVLTIEFNDFLVAYYGRYGAPDVFYPMTINYLVNGRLFKRTEVVDFKGNPSTKGFPVSSLRKKAIEHAPTQAPTLLPTISSEEETQ